MELQAQDQIAEKKSNLSKLNSEKLRKIYINLMEDEKELKKFDIAFENYISVCGKCYF